MILGLRFDFIVGPVLRRPAIVRGGEVRLCDGLDDGCETFAETSGIERASAAHEADGVGGRFIGRVRDGAVEGLSHVPDQVEGP